MKFQGKVSRIIFRADSFVIARLSVSDSEDITIVGDLPGLQSHDEIIVHEARKENHPKYGDQFRIKSWEKIVPTTEEGVIAFLSSGAVSGVGPVKAKAIVDHLGVNAIEIVTKKGYKSLLPVKGFGEKTAIDAYLSIMSQMEFHGILTQLSPTGLPSNTIVKAYKEWGAETVKVIQENPYRLTDLRFIGFHRADQLAKEHLGIPHDSSYRVESGILYSLRMAGSEGHCFLPFDECLSRSAKVLELTHDIIERAITKMGNHGRLSIVKERVALPYIRETEENIAQRLIELQRAECRAVNVSEPVALFEKKNKIRLHEGQRQAVSTLFRNNISVLTGGPGTGKTLTIRSIYFVAQRLGISKVMLAAPTGRAARVMSDVVGAPASTIHRLLQMQPGGRPAFNKDNPLDCDILIVDEASMLDIFLIKDVLSAVKPGTRILFVGDKDQLPSVGAGNVLHDLIKTDAFPVIRLTQLFRQGERSKISLNARKVNVGERLDYSDADDFFFIEEDDIERSVQFIEKSFIRLVRRFGPVEAQVLSPMRKGLLGVDNLNKILQQACNPPSSVKREWRMGDTIFRLGDKVMQTRNNYTKKVYNGEIGIITKMGENGSGEKMICVQYNGTEILYDPDEIKELTLAYAITVHKSQGSEFKGIIMPVTCQHYILLARNVLYTAISRAKEICALVGTYKAVNIAVRNNKISNRYTSLPECLMESVSPQ